MIKKIILLILICSFAACVRQSDIIGKYETHFPFGDETLVLYADGQFEQIFVFNLTIGIHEDGKEIENIGHWEFDKSIPVINYRIRLEDYIIFWDWPDIDKPVKELKKTNVTWQVSKYWGPVKITFNGDQGGQYVKFSP